MPDTKSQRPRAKYDQRVADDWDVLAPYYDSQHGELGNEWHRNLVLPTTLKLLGDVQGKGGIDLCCGSGTLIRKLVELGAQVTGADQSKEFLSLAQQYDGSADVEWVCSWLADLPQQVKPKSFDFVTCTMALMDVPDNGDLYNAIAHCLKPQGIAVVVTMHPAFKNPSNLRWWSEKESPKGELQSWDGIVINRYLTPFTQEVIGIPGQPKTHLNYHRSLSDELNSAFDAGLVVDGFAEVAKDSADDSPSTHPHAIIPPTLGDEIPVLLGIRFRPSPW